MPVKDQGVFEDRYTLIPRTLIFITRAEQILLLRGAPNKRLWANQYNGIGGHVERGEDVLTAARRELKEETGMQLEDLWLCGTIIVDTGRNPGINIHIFKGEYSSGQIEPSSEGTLTWVSIDQIKDLPLVEDLYTLIPKILTLKKNDPPISGLYSYDEEDRLVITFHE